MDEQERLAFKQALKARFRDGLLRDIENFERAFELQGVPLSRTRIIRDLRMRVLRQFEQFRARVPLARMEEVDIRIAAYCEMMDEFIRSASN